MVPDKDWEFFSTMLENVLEKKQDKAATAMGKLSVDDVTQKEVVRFWSERGEPEVLATCALTGLVPEEMIRRTLSLVDNHLVQEGLARCKDTPESILQALCASDSEDVRVQLALNPSVKVGTIMALQNDSSDRVREALNSRNRR